MSATASACGCESARDEIAHVLLMAGLFPDDWLNAYDHERAELIRAHTREDFSTVLAAYGSAYANGWRFGRGRAADLVEEGETE